MSLFVGFGFVIQFILTVGLSYGVECNLVAYKGHVCGSTLTCKTKCICSPGYFWNGKICHKCKYVYWYSNTTKSLQNGNIVMLFYKDYMITKIETGLRLFWIRVLFFLDLGNGGKCTGYVGYKGRVCSGNLRCLSGKCVCKSPLVWNGQKCAPIPKRGCFIHLIFILAWVGEDLVII